MLNTELPIDAKKAAYHEAGHIIFAYFAQWSVQKVELFEKNGKIINAVTSYDFKEDEMIVKSLTDQQTLNELTLDEKSILYGIIHKRCTSLLGGPIAEAYFINGIDFKGLLTIDLRGPDALNSYNLENLMTAFFKEDELVSKSLKELIPIGQKEIFWKSITSIAEKILLTKSFSLSQQEIESILTETGFITYINKIST